MHYRTAEQVFPKRPMGCTAALIHSAHNKTGLQICLLPMRRCRETVRFSSALPCASEKILRSDNRRHSSTKRRNRMARLGAPFIANVNSHPVILKEQLQQRIQELLKCLPSFSRRDAMRMAFSVSSASREMDWALA